MLGRLSRRRLLVVLPLGLAIIWGRRLARLLRWNGLTLLQLTRAVLLCRVGERRPSVAVLLPLILLPLVLVLVLRPLIL